MWPLTVLLVTCLVASALGEGLRSLRSSAAAVEKEGKALPGVLQQQWVALSAELHTSFDAAAKNVTAAYTEPASKKAASDAIALLRKLVASRFDADEAFKKSETSDIAGLVAKYSSLINERLRPESKDAGGEDAILALRKAKQALFLKLENEYLGMLATTRSIFRQAFKTNSNENATVRKNVRESAGKMLLHLVNNQKKCMAVLTGQFGLVEKFAIAADNVLWRIAVPAQSSVL